jgi:hypothetical protein
LQERQRRREVAWGTLQTKLRDWVFTGYKVEVLLRQLGEVVQGSDLNMRAVLEQATMATRGPAVSEATYARVLDGLDDLLERCPTSSSISLSTIRSLR